MDELRVNPSRLQENFDELSKIGTTSDGGVHRPALSQAHLEARGWFQQKIREAGLDFYMDGCGNHFAKLNCGGADAASLLLGSHLDSVVHGGQFDGALGVVAALEVLQVIKESNLSLPVNLEAVDFTDEEGTLVGLLGSSSVAGKLAPDALQNPRGGRGNLIEGLKRAGLNEADLLNNQRDPSTLAGYLELHIEQGPNLFKQKIDIGVVSGIVGIYSYLLEFTGRPNHAGTTPIRDRLDAAQGACAFTLAARKIILEDFPDCVANVGRIEFSPGAFNVVPGKATVWLEFRSPDPVELTQLEAAMLNAAEAEANRFGLMLNTTSLDKHIPAPMSETAQEAIHRASEQLGLTHLYLPSGAGHDAQMMAGLCPAGMIFIPSAEGISHSPDEFSTWQDCVNGANVLLQAALHFIRLAD